LLTTLVASLAANEPSKLGDSQSESMETFVIFPIGIKLMLLLPLY